MNTYKHRVQVSDRFNINLDSIQLPKHKGVWDLQMGMAAIARDPQESAQDAKHKTRASQMPADTPSYYTRMCSQSVNGTGTCVNRH